MGDIDSVTGVNLVQIEKRQLKIENVSNKKLDVLFYLFLLLGDMAKKSDFLRIFDQFLNL